MTPRSVLDRIVRWASGREPRPAGLRGAGDDWERLAEKRLTSAGYRILDRNFRTRSGELDFVAEENGVLCFVEVKGRSGTGFGLPAEAVTSEKQRRIFRTAQAWLARERREDEACRFDVVAILAGGDERPRVEILRDAFRGPAPPRRRR